MGMAVEIVDKVPTFLNPLQTPSDPQYKAIMELSMNIGSALRYVYDAITLTRKKLDGLVPLIGFCGAP